MGSYRSIAMRVSVGWEWLAGDQSDAAPRIAHGTIIHVIRVVLRVVYQRDFVGVSTVQSARVAAGQVQRYGGCLLYTSDAADE